jgi:hypothetical protein
VALFTAMSDHSPAPKLRDFKVGAKKEEWEEWDGV